MLDVTRANEDMPAASEAVSKRYSIKAVPLPKGGFLGEYAFPGVRPYYVSDRGQPTVHGSEAEALTSAAIALTNALNNRPRQRGKPERYTKLTGPEFAALLSETGITPTFFAELYGTSSARIVEWMDSVTDVPHPVRLLLEIFRRDPGAIDTAEAITKTATVARSPRGTTE
jgi:DNA-binding transcriptional regulator YiaG